MNFNSLAHQLHPSAGGNSSGLWLLSEEQLVKQCSESGLDVTGTKNELITRLAQHRKGQLTLGENCCLIDKCFKLTLSALYVTHECVHVGCQMVSY